MADGRQLTIHGHFYQPPREDPWLDAILPEGSAAPFLHWNERICAESYAPLAFARRLDARGRIIEIMNCYEYMSFNFGPTLLVWLERHAPEVYARVLEGDRKSRERLGHGNAIAQIYHHVIMPLATDLDKRAEIAWALADFEARFKRPAEGMWLSEAAVDTRTLDLLARAGVKFTILAPRQASHVADIGADNWTEVHENDLDIRRPYLAELPEGRSIAIFFYDGALSQAVAFEGLLRHGDFLWGRLAAEAGDGLLALATDGETYGHHVRFGEMALAFALSQARAGVAGMHLTNYATFLAENPPERRVRIRENTSWSCVHGVERWRADCGCNAEHRPGWNQRWRGPLRDGLNAVKARIDAHFASLGATLFRSPENALIEYGRVLSGLDAEEDFAARHFRAGLASAQVHTAWRLLTMEKWALSAFASCAWFFDDLGRIEPLNALTFCLRAMQIGRRTGLEDLEPLLLSHLGKASSNDPALGNGHDLWTREVRPRRETDETLIGQALLRLWAEGGLPGPGESGSVEWPGLRVELRLDEREMAGNDLSGKARIFWRRETACDEVEWTWERDGGDPFAGCVRTGAGEGAKCVPAAYLPWNKRQAIAVIWVHHAAAEAWHRQLDEARQGEHLFLPYREAQTAQTESARWNCLWPALAWLWITSGSAVSDDFLNFLHAQAAADGPRGAMLGRRLGAALSGLLAAERPDYAVAGGILDRSARAGVAPDLRAAQNVWWTRHKEDPAGRETGRRLGFAPEVLP